MKQALKKVLNFLRLRQISTIELPEKSKLLKIEETELDLKFKEYALQRTSLSKSIPTAFILTKFNPIEYNRVEIEVLNTETQGKFTGVILGRKDGVIQFKLNNNSNDPINFLPVLEKKNFIGIKTSLSGHEIFFDNSTELPTSSKYLKQNFLKTSVFKESSLYININPFYVEHRVYVNEFQTLTKLEFITFYGITAIQTTHFNTQECYGLPERNSTLRLKDDSYRLFNVDRVSGGVNADQLYGSVPLLYNKHENIYSAFLVDNPSDAIVSITTNLQNKNVSWKFITGNLSCFFYCDDETNIFYKNGKVTGFSVLPPIFALGYHQCRWGYDSFDDAQKTEIGFDDHDIPLDVFWFDIDHTDRKHYFTWNKTYDKVLVKNFLNLLESKKRKLVTIIDPHLSTDDDYTISKDLINNNCVVLDKDKKPFIGECWPGKSVYGDFLNPNIQFMYSDKFYKTEEYFMNSNIVYSWCDMNEPSVFDGPEKTFPNNNYHFDGKNYIKHQEIHNLYGQMYQRTCNNALKARYPGKRPFTLTRSTYTGSQQISFHWTGDNSAKWEFLKNSLEMLMTLNYSGMNNVGADVGGFIGDPTEDLFGYWYEVGTFYPFYRGHSDINSKRREPWKFSDETLKRVRNAICLRYNLLHFFYTCSYIANHTGRPHIKPYEGSDHLYCYGDTFVLVVKDAKDKNDVDLLKKRKLYDFRTGKELTNDSCLNLNSDLKSNLTILVQGGKIIPWIEKALISSDFTLKNPQSLMIFPDEKGYAYGLLYSDDGISYDYENGNYTLTEFILTNFNHLTTNVIHKPEPKDLDTSKTTYCKNFWENIYLFGHPNGEEISTADLLIDTFTQPITSNFSYDKEAGLLLTTEIMVSVTESFEITFS